MDEDADPLGENAAADPMQGDSRSGSPQAAEVKWSSKVGDQLKRDEQCLFQTVGSIFYCVPSSRWASELTRLLDDRQRQRHD